MTFETEPTEESVAPVQPFDDGAPPAMAVPPPPQRRRRIWPWVVIIVVLITGLAVVAASSITVDYYAVAPGPVENVADYVVIDGDSFDADGDLMEGSHDIIVGEWRRQWDGWEQLHWEHLWDCGRVSAEEAYRWAAEVWPQEDDCDQEIDDARL